MGQESWADTCCESVIDTEGPPPQSNVQSASIMSSFVGYDVVSRDNNADSNPSLSDCHGTWLVSFDGKTKAGGYCAFRDNDGDVEYVAWEAMRDSGTWRAIGGTGKWASKQRSGWVREVARDGQMVMVEWGGTCDAWDVCRARTSAGIWALKAMSNLSIGLFDTKLTDAAR